MHTFAARAASGIAAAVLTIAGIAGCSNDKGDHTDAVPPAGTTAGASGGSSGASPTASPGGVGGDTAVAKRQAAGLPSGFPDSCLLLTAADLKKIARLTEDPQGDTIGKGSDAISSCSWTNGEGTTVIVRAGQATHFDAEVTQGDKITKSTSKGLTGVGDQARISMGQAAPGLEMAVITARAGDKYVQVITAIYGLTNDQLKAATQQFTTLALGRL